MSLREFDRICVVGLKDDFVMGGSILCPWCLFPWKVVSALLL